MPKFSTVMVSRYLEIVNSCTKLRGQILLLFTTPNRAWFYHPVVQVAFWYLNPISESFINALGTHQHPCGYWVWTIGYALVGQLCSSIASMLGMCKSQNSIKQKPMTRLEDFNCSHLPCFSFSTWWTFSGSRKYVFSNCPAQCCNQQTTGQILPKALSSPLQLQFILKLSLCPFHLVVIG